MNDDTWWAFIATIDRASLLQELPGSPSDRRMRERHEAIREQYWRQERLPKIDGSGRLVEAVSNSRGWTVRYGTDRRRQTPVTDMDKQVAAYAAQRRARKRAERKVA